MMHTNGPEKGAREHIAEYGRSRIDKVLAFLSVDCIRCYEAHPDANGFNRPFIVCATCGNKRCPKATDHNLECGNSNDPGQPGSDY